MKVTLISPYSDITSYGLRCLSAYLKSLGHRVTMIFLPDYREEVEDRRDADDRYSAGPHGRDRPPLRRGAASSASPS